ncbi:hypothetical protein ACJMK2_035445 [Sinanodonta woodiana]|uniref:Uncharacterized protein n=1 Tax=Sinanodonta woodiana TaxID=1069815 RepID=A0ABD3WYZ7_SINWO
MEAIEDRTIEQDQPRTKRQRIDIIPVQEGNWIAGLYNSMWYIGRVVEQDNEDGELLVNFMEKSGKLANTFKWPRQKDEILITPQNVVYLPLDSPVPVGKTTRSMKVPQK